MSRETDEVGAPPELPSVEKGPRAPDQQAWTGTGTPRSGDDGLQEQGAVGDRSRNDDIDPAITVGATTSSHPADADEIEINRSGSGGSGGATTNDADADGSTPATMDELLGGDPSGGVDR
jgi:hypothetical protein